MAFEILLQIPAIKAIAPPLSAIEDRSAGMLDDDPDRPLFLIRASEIFDANGVKFEIRGCLIGSLSTSFDLPYFLEGLPGLIDFLHDTAKGIYKLGLWRQVTDAEIIFSKMDSGIKIEVQTEFSSTTNAPRSSELMSYDVLKSQVVNFIMSYREGIALFYPEIMNEPWNQNIFSFARGKCASD